MCSPEWITDEVINAYGRLIVDASLKNELFKSVFVFDTHCLQLNSLNIVDPKSLFQKDVLLFPCNSQNSHWYLIAVDLISREIHIIDSIPEFEDPSRKIE